MQKKLFKMMLLIEEGMTKKNTFSTIFYSLRNNAQQVPEINRHSAAKQFIEAEMMEECPNSKPIAKGSTRESVMKEKVHSKLGKDIVRQVAVLALKLQKQLTYLQLESLSQLLPILNTNQRSICRRSLQMISSKIKYTLNANKIKEEHVIEAAERVFAEIHLILTRRSRQIL